MKQRNSQTSTPVIVEEEESSEVQPEAARSTREVLAEAGAHSPRRETVSLDADKVLYFEFKLFLIVNVKE